MKKIYSIFFAIIAIAVAGCSSNDDLYNEMPKAIESFVSQYYPNSQLASFVENDNKYRLVIKGGPTMVFDKNCQWQTLNGNGSPLPSNFLFNEMPPEVYAYLQETENLNEVYSTDRSNDDYTVVLLNYTITYNTSTGKLTGDDAK